MGESACLVRSFSEPIETSSYGANEVNPIRALTESVSFGRFMSEPLSWEKWSTFSQNRYLEEIDRFSKPGSVAQKKAFFEAFYKKRAATKAQATLENAAKTANGIPKAESANATPKDCSFNSGSEKMDTAIDGENQKDENQIEKRAAMKAFLEAQYKKRVVTKAQEVQENKAEIANGISEAESGDGTQKDTSVDLESGKLDAAIDGNLIELDCAVNDALCCPSSEEIPNFEQEQTFEQQEVDAQESMLSENDVKDPYFDTESEKSVSAIDGEGQRDDNQIELDGTVNDDLCCSSSKEMTNVEQDQTLEQQEVDVDESMLSENDVNRFDKVKPEEMILKERNSTSSSKGTRSSSSSVRKRTSEVAKKEKVSAVNSKISQIASKRKPNTPFDSASHPDESSKTLLKIPRKGPGNRAASTSLDNKGTIREPNMKKRLNPSSVHMSTGFASSSAQTGKHSLKKPMNVSTTQVSATSKVRNHMVVNGKASIGSSGRQNKSLPMNLGSQADGSGKTSVKTAKPNSDSARCTSTRTSVSGLSKFPSRNLPSRDRDRRLTQTQSTLEEKVLNQSGNKTRSSTVSSPFRFRSDERAAKRKEFFEKMEEKNKREEVIKEKLPSRSKVAATRVSSQNDKRSSKLSQSSSHSYRSSKPPQCSSVNAGTVNGVGSKNRQTKIHPSASRPAKKAQEKTKIHPSASMPAKKAQENSPPNIRR